jgi:putative MATE family efflux protein
MSDEKAASETGGGVDSADDQKKNRVDEFIAHPRKAVWKLAVPVMLGMVVQTAYSLTDMIFVGQLGSDAIAALTFNMPLGFFSIGITFGLGVGATSAIARLLGAKNKGGANNAASHALLVGMLAGILIPALGLLFKERIFAALGVPPKVIGGALIYFSIIAPSFVFSNLNVQFRSILTGEGDTRTPIAFQIGGTLLNLLLDPLLIFTAGWGIAGAAWATLISQAAVFLVFFYYFFIRKGTYLEPPVRSFVYSWKVVKQILQIGFPASLSMVVMSVGGMFFNRLVSLFGSDAVAAFGIGGRLDSVYFLPNFALASSMVTLTGMFHGAGRIDLVRKTVYYVFLRGQYMALGFGVIFYFFAPQIFPIFTEDKAILDMAVSYIRTVVFSFPFITVGVISGRVFQGLGEGVPSLLLTAMRVILVSGALAVLFVHVLDMGLESIWLALAIGAAITSTVATGWILVRLNRLEREAGVVSERSHV